MSKSNAWCGGVATLAFALGLVGACSGSDGARAGAPTESNGSQAGDGAGGAGFQFTPSQAGSNNLTPAASCPPRPLAEKCPPGELDDWCTMTAAKACAPDVGAVVYRSACGGYLAFVERNDFTRVYTFDADGIVIGIKISGDTTVNCDDGSFSFTMTFGETCEPAASTPAPCLDFANDGAAAGAGGAAGAGAVTGGGMAGVNAAAGVSGAG